MVWNSFHACFKKTVSIFENMTRAREREREREREKFCVINVKYKEISWRVRRRRKKKKRKKVSSRSTEELEHKNGREKNCTYLAKHKCLHKELNSIFLSHLHLFSWCLGISKLQSNVGICPSDSPTYLSLKNCRKLKYGTTTITTTTHTVIQCIIRLLFFLSVNFKNH